MKKRYWPIPIIGLFLLSFLRPAPENILSSYTFSTVVRDNKGEPLRVFQTEDDKYRIWMDISRFPRELIEALLLKEDQYFYNHPGVDIPALFRAGYETYLKQERRVGASTLTMQLVRLRDKDYTRNFTGKLKQIYKALYMDLHYSKQEILEAYLNLAPCGGNIEGFPAASEYYFHKQPQELTLSEILFLTVLPQKPEVRSPKGGVVPEDTLKARSLLFDQWTEKHPKDKSLAYTMEMPVRIEGSFPFLAPHGTEYIAERFEGERGNIVTTIDKNLQKLVKEQLDGYLRNNKSQGVQNGAVLLLEASTGNVLSLIGSSDYFNDEIQGQVKGFSAKRSPGSTLKPFIYALGIDQGVIHPHTMQKDAPETFGVYTPDNFMSDFRGPVFAWEALVQSRNIPSINLANHLKDPDLYGFLKEADIEGLKERDHYGLSIVLGSAEVTMLELGALYAMLANSGVYREVNFIQGAEVKPGKQLFSSEAGYLTWEMLKRNPSPVEYRPRETRDYPVAYKTGTSIGFKDSWTAGIFGDYVLVVWIGNFNGRGNTSFIGRRMAAPLFFYIADSLFLEKQPVMRASTEKRNIKEVEVCSVSGGIPKGNCPRTVLTGFIPGVSPITRCHIHREIWIDTSTGYRTDKKQSPGVKRVIREVWPSDLLKLFEQAGLPILKPPP